MSRNYQRSTRVIGNNHHHKRAPNPGVVMLTQIADRKVQDECENIANALAQQAIKGNVSSARLLVDLAEGAEWAEDPATVEQVLSVVEQWVKEPKCTDEIGEAAAGVLAPGGIIAPLPEVTASTYVN